MKKPYERPIFLRAVKALVRVTLSDSFGQGHPVYLAYVRPHPEPAYLPVLAPVGSLCSARIKNCPRAKRAPRAERARAKAMEESQSLSIEITWDTGNTLRVYVAAPPRTEPYVAAPPDPKGNRMWQPHQPLALVVQDTAALPDTPARSPTVQNGNRPSPSKRALIVRCEGR